MSTRQAMTYIQRLRKEGPGELGNLPSLPHISVLVQHGRSLGLTFDEDDLRRAWHLDNGLRWLEYGQQQRSEEAD